MPPPPVSISARPPEMYRPPRRFGTRLSETFAALRYPNYRLWFLGQLVSLFGSWMQATAQGYFIYELTQSPAYLGYVGFANGLPTWIFTLFGGVVADRIPRRNLLVITQIGMMALAAILAILTFTGLVQPWHILLLAFLLGVANAFDAPARQAFVRELVDRETLTNAIALNATMFNSATAVGPAVAGLVYALVGPAWCFTINGISFIAVIGALLLMHLPAWHAPERRGSALSDIAEGFRYVASQQTVKVIIAGLGMIALFGMAAMTLLPAWSVEILGGDATTNGLLQSSRGFGALIGALMIASLGASMIRGRWIMLGNFIFPIFILIYSQLRWMPLSMLALAGFGWSFMVQANLSNSLVQTQVPDNLRGRVMGIYTMIFFGFFPLGSLLAGKAAEWIGEPATVVAGGIIMMVFALFVFIRYPQMRQLR